MRYLIDAQLPPALARFLTANGEDAVHVLDVKMMEASDSEIWDLTMQEEMVIITKDEDFQVRASVTQHHPIIIWVRIGNCSKKTLLDFFEKRWREMNAELDNGATLIELLG
jgi:predicted nuclease of predicted toxin-antitoxin system